MVGASVYSRLFKMKCNEGGLLLKCTYVVTVNGFSPVRLISFRLVSFRVVPFRFNCSRSRMVVYQAIALFLYSIKINKSGYLGTGISISKTLKEIFN